MPLTRNDQNHLFFLRSIHMINLFVLVILLPVNLAAMDDLSTIIPPRLMHEAVSYKEKSDFAEVGRRIALSKILTRVSAACLKDNLGADSQEVTIKELRKLPFFKRETSHQYSYTTDPRELEAFIESSEFKNIFRAQVRVVGNALIQEKLPHPGQITKGGRFHFLYFSPEPNKFIPQGEWFARRAEVINEYFEDTSLFPEGPPMHILLQEPKPARGDNGWCALQ